MNDNVRRVGVDAVDRVVVMENHDAAYGVWRDAGMQRRVLMHVDAHHDMWWETRPDQTSIASFVSVAIADNLVRDVYWVVPDRGWGSAATRRPLVHHLRELIQEYPDSDCRIQVDPDRLSVHLDLGSARLTVCPFRCLPRLKEAVLLDIDVDFMVIPRVSFGRLDEQDPRPWCWPAELIDRLREAEVRTDLVTIALSVEGGYTPLKWKYLGDELVQRLADPSGRGTTIQALDLMREASAAVARGEAGEAERLFRAAAEALPDAAPPRCHLAHLAVAAGQLDDARRLHEQVLAIDSSYRTPFSSRGFPCYWHGRIQEAGREFRRSLQLDPRDPYAHLGVGLLAADARRWDEAFTHLTRALSIDDRLVEGHRALGRVLARTGRRDEAIGAYERSLQLTLAGAPLLERAIVTGPGDGRVEDPDHGRTHAELARLHDGRGSIARAIIGYRMSIAGGHDGVALRCRLAWLYLKQGDWRPAGVHCWRSVQQALAACTRAVRRGVRHARRLAAHWRPDFAP